MLAARRLLRSRHSSYKATALRPLYPLACSERPEHEQNDNERGILVRSYHATKQREILPLIAVGTVLFIGRYSWKAMKRMDEEWEDYQWELRRYEKQMARSNPSSETSKALAIDLGTLYTKFATSHPKPDVVVSREGDRAFFNGVIEQDASPVMRGRAALDRYFYRPLGQDDADGYDHEQVTLPYLQLMDTKDESKVVTDSVQPALREALDRIDYQPNPNKPLRLVVTAPVSHLHSNVYEQAFTSMIDDTVPNVLPEPVAALWGAQTRALIPADEETTTAAAPMTSMVIDVGGLITQLAVIQKDVVLWSLTLPFGGEYFVRSAMDLLLKESPTPLKDARSLSAVQVQARAAVAELTTKTRVSVHVPYLFADPRNHHLDTALSRNVLEQAVHATIRDYVVADAAEEVFSPHFPKPTDLTSLWVSTITELLERSAQMPSNIDYILLVGGGSKPPVVTYSLRNALFTLMGSDVSTKLKVPESALQTELTVLGAATMLPGFGYTVDYGLKPL